MIGSKESFYCFVFCTRWLSCKEKWHPETLSVEQRMLQIDGMSGVHDPSQGKSCWVNEQKVEKGQIVLASTGSQPIRNSSILNSQKPWGETRVKQAQPTTHRNHVSQSEGTLWFLSSSRACWILVLIFPKSRLQGQSCSEKFQAAESAGVGSSQNDPKGSKTLWSLCPYDVFFGSLHASVQLGECFQLRCCTFWSFQKFRDCRRLEQSGTTFATCDQHVSNDLHLVWFVRKQWQRWRGPCSCEPLQCCWTALALLPLAPSWHQTIFVLHFCGKSVSKAHETRVRGVVV